MRPMAPSKDSSADRANRFDLTGTAALRPGHTISPSLATRRNARAEEAAPSGPGQPSRRSIDATLTLKDKPLSSKRSQSGLAPTTVENARHGSIVGPRGPRRQARDALLRGRRLCDDAAPHAAARDSHGALRHDRRPQRRTGQNS